MNVVTGNNVRTEDNTLYPLKLLREDFLSLGNEVTIWPQAKLVNAHNISLGHKVIIDDFVLIIASGAPVGIGSFVHIAAYSSITGQGGLAMDDFSGLAAGVRIITSDEDYSGGTCLTNPTVFKEYRKVRHAHVHIKKHAIIGTNTVVLPGVTIGEGCAVGANALVVKDLPDWSVCVGTPARPVKERPSETIKKLESDLRSRYPEMFTP